MQASPPTAGTAIPKKGRSPAATGAGVVRFLRKGKVKEVYEVSEDELEFVFTDQISVFDKIISTLVPHKGETLCRTAAHWFQVVQDLGIRTHFLRLEGGNRMRVRRVQVIPEYDRITPKTKNFLIPLEVIARYYVAGSLHDRIKEGRVRPQAIGFPRGHVPAYGEALPKPFVEVTTKLEQVDRELTTDEALAISKLSRSEYEALGDAVLKIDSRLNADVRARGLIHVDGKKEFAMDGDRKLMLVDTFGTADEDRFWDLTAYGQGQQVELSKEFVRQYYRKIGYHKALMDARAAHKPEPDIPPLPEDITKQVSDLYVNLFERLTGETFR